VDVGTAAAGTYTLTVTGAAPSATHSTVVTLTVMATASVQVSAPRTVGGGGGAMDVWGLFTLGGLLAARVRCRQRRAN
jgi:hypothetical protein